MVALIECTSRVSPAVREQVTYLDAVLQAWPASPPQRRRWLDFSRRLQRWPTGGRIETPALIPSLVRARLVAALTLAGLSPATLPGRRIVTLGAHMGLEVRMLRDGGADAVGVEHRPQLVRAGIHSGMLPADALIWDDALHYLEGPVRRLDALLWLAPQAVAWSRLMALALPWLRPTGVLAVVAHWPDLPPAFRPRALPVLDGTMAGLCWRPARLSRSGRRRPARAPSGASAGSGNRERLSSSAGSTGADIQ